MFKAFIFSSIALVLLLTVNYAYALPIYMRPDGFAENNWQSGTSADIDETGRDDSDYVTSRVIQQNQNDRVAFSLSNEVDPVVDTDHVVRYTFREDGLSTDSPRLEVRLKQGTTVLITWVEPAPLPNVFTLATRQVPEEIAHQINDYSDLRLEFEAICTTAGGLCDNTAPRESVSVSWAEIQYETYTTPRAHLPPKVTGIGFYKIEPVEGQSVKNLYAKKSPLSLSNYSKHTDTTDPQNYGKYNKTGRFFELGKPIPTFTANILEPIQTQIRLEGVFASTRIEHLSLISTNTKSDPKSSNFEIIVDKGKKPIIIDPNKILKDVKATYSLEDGYLWVNLDLVFQKPLKKSHLTLQAWDEARMPVYSEIFDAWEISDPRAQIVTVERSDRIRVEIIQKPPQSECPNNNSCFVPSELTIRKGGSVVWENSDSVIHTVVSGNPKSGPDGKFNFAIPPHRSFEKYFPIIGSYPYYCSLHPWYVGTIIVSDIGDQAKPKQYHEFKITSKSTGSLIKNEQTVVLKDRNTNFVVSGHVPNIKRHTVVDISIKKPDNSTENLSIKTTIHGEYSTLVKLVKKWQSGKYEIAANHKGSEIGHINFTITDKPIKR